MSFIKVEGLTVKLGSSIALEEVTFTLESPFFTVVMGPNGAGKTTLLRTILGLIKPYKGSLNIYGYDPIKNPSKVRQLVGYVPQIININTHVPMTVKEVIEMGLLSRVPPPRRMTADVKRDVDEILDVVGLNGYESKLFTELSGGQRQRVLIARALVRRPKLLLLDEPFSMLDFDIKCDLAGMLYRVHKELGIDILLVAHELSPCMTYEPTVILLNKRVYAVGKAHEVLQIGKLRLAYPGLTEGKGLLILGEDHA